MRRTTRGLICAALLAAAAAGAGCGDGSGSGSGDGKLRVVAAFYPLYEAATKVGGDDVAVTNITPPGSEPHDVELSTRQVDKLEDADVVLYIGGDFQPALERVVRSNNNGVDLLGAGETDPHVWLDPVRFADVLRQTASALAKARPSDKAAFEANAVAYTETLDQLDADFRTGLAECERREIVVAHDAFRHMTARYDLTEHAIAGLSPEAEPSTTRLAELADLVRSRGLTTVLTETLVSPRVAEALAREAGVVTAVLDPIEGLSRRQVDAGDDYETVMRRNLDVLRRALECK